MTETRKRPQQISSAYREVGGEQVGRAGKSDPGVVVLPDTAAAALHPGLPHALRSRLQAGQQLVRVITVQVLGDAWGIWSHFPAQRVKDKDDGDHGGSNDNPAVRSQAWDRLGDREGRWPEPTPHTPSKPCFCTAQGEAEL